MTSHLQGTFRVRVCPFCGIAADAPHETQEGCIEALHAEITRVRDILDQAHPSHSKTSPPEDTGV